MNKGERKAIKHINNKLSCENMFAVSSLRQWKYNKPKNASSAIASIMNRYTLSFSPII